MPGYDAAERVWNPYSWRLRELAALGDDAAAAARRRALSEDLVVAEAAELARGIHHVSIVHGDPVDLHQADQVDTFLAQVEQEAAEAEWSRRRGDHEHIIVAMGGADAEARISHITGLANLANPGHWVVTTGARPTLLAAI
jgi:NAD(P)-dependent dehydrogenase (short-subunit alcohol dehydrogenase family)